MFEISEFRGHKMVVLKRDKEDQYPYQFGLGKAQLILDHIEEIKQFVKDNTPTK